MLEHVIAELEYETDSESSVEITLCSPGSTCSVVLHSKSGGTYENKTVQRTWPFLNLHFWGESPHGAWTLFGKSKGGGKCLTISKHVLNAIYFSFLIFCTAPMKVYTKLK